MGIDYSQNPLGIKSIDHLEFTTDKLDGEISKLFHRLGFTQTHQNLDEKKVLFSQGQIRFLLTANQSEKAHSRQYYLNHGDGVSTMSFLVHDCEHAIKTAKERGANCLREVSIEETPEGPIKTAAIAGFGDVVNEFVERPSKAFRNGFSLCKEDTKAKPLQTRVSRIDHLTNNVPFGEMEKWVQFYKDIYGFVETRYFDIKGAKTGLLSKVVQSPDGSVIIPINQPEIENGKSQIQEFLDRHKGAGVQHIALTTPDIITTIADLQERDIRFLEIPSTYYEDIPARGLNVTEDLKVLEKHQLLVDGDEEGYLLQIFSDTYVGPLFFEYIQRKNHGGFGEGNFQALFNAIERDQQKRGYL
jgi:4-hydroxyphenylpyruvate dioxygenase